MDPVLIIDGSHDGLKEAATYYRAFPHEPSPLGELSFSKDNIKVMHPNASLDIALDEMLKVGAGGIVVLVCHAYTHGLLLTLATGNDEVFADIDNLATIDKVIAAESEVSKIRALQAQSGQNQAAAEKWKQLLNSLQPGWVVGTISVDEGAKAYSQWIRGWAKTFKFKDASHLVSFAQKVVRLRTLKLSRIELRACNIGSDDTTMEAVRKFFGVDHLTAPIVGTFFGMVPVFAMAPENGVSSAIGVIGAGRTPGPTQRLPLLLQARDGALMAQTNHSRRGFVPVENIAYDARIPSSLGPRHYQFILTVDEVAAFKYSFFAYVVTSPNSRSPNWKIVREFLAEWVMPGSTYTTGSFPIMGLWTADEGMPDMPYVLPNESGYLMCIEQAPPRFPPQTP
jgi:hypothetical protein